VTCIDVDEAVEARGAAMSGEEMAKAIDDEGILNRVLLRRQFREDQQYRAKQLRVALAMVDGIKSEHCSRHQCNRYVYHCISYIYTRIYIYISSGHDINVTVMYILYIRHPRNLYMRIHNTNRLQ
jgi:hypothetical protein